MVLNARSAPSIFGGCFPETIASGGVLLQGHLQNQHMPQNYCTEAFSLIFPSKAHATHTMEDIMTSQS